MCLWRLWEQCPWCNTKLWPLSLHKTDTRADANVVYMCTAFQIQTKKIHKCTPADKNPTLKTEWFGLTNTFHEFILIHHDQKMLFKVILCPTIMFVLWCSKVGQTASSETQQTSSVRWPLWQSAEIKTTFVVVVWILRQLNRNLISNQTLLNDDVTNHVSREFLV